MLIKKVLNTEKKGKIKGHTLHLIHLKDRINCVLYDETWTAPIIYAGKGVVIFKICNDQLDPPFQKEKINMYVYKTQPDGHLKFVGSFKDKLITELTSKNLA